MQKLIIYSDLHRYSKFELPIKLEEGAFYIGDIFDVMGCRKEDIPKVLNEMHAWNKFADGRYCYGNHESFHDRAMEDYVIGRVVLTHGAYESWGQKKLLKYLSKPLGKTNFQRNVSAMMHQARKLKPFWMSKKQKERCVDRCIDAECDTIIMGHKHPTKIKDFHYRSERGPVIRIVVVPPGRSVVEV